MVARLVFESSELGATWGVIYGIVLGTFAFLIVLARGCGWLAIVGRWLLVVALAFVSWWVVFFAVGTPLLSLEGAWLWPLGMFCLSACAFVARWAWRSLRTPARPRPSLERE